MSSVISTERSTASTPPHPGPLPASAERERDRSTFRPWHFFIVGALIAATAAVLLSPRNTPEYLVMLSLTVFAAGAAAYACYRMLAPLVGQETAPYSGLLGAVARRSMEREKAIVMRSIKELEFDRAMGKIADDDFADMSGRLRQRALRLMRQLDDVEATARARVERELSTRLGGVPAPAPAGERATRPTCRACQTVNDVDARFCKNCGGALSS
jgi:hypothetical protein